LSKGEWIATRPDQSAALPYRVRDGRVEVLLVTRRGGDGWIIPKGKVEARLGAAKSAAREAEEEAGVRGLIEDASFDRYKHGGGEDGPLVEVFLMRVTREMRSWREAHERERRWAALDEVPALVVDPGLARVMRAAAEHLATHAWQDAEDVRTGRRGRRPGLVHAALVAAAAVGAAALALLAG
jgi:8-oxo-dGTP pyrophosphatase MutT (NUDIX family)